MVWSGDGREIIPSALHSTGANPHALSAMQEVTLTFDLMVCNVTVTSARSDLHRLNHKYKKNQKERESLCGGRPVSDTPLASLLRAPVPTAMLFAGR